MTQSDLGQASTRAIPGLRALRTLVRAAHLVAVAAFYGGHVHGVPADRLEPALLGVVCTGAAFSLLEMARAPVWLVQVRGAAVYTKVALMLGAATSPPLRIPLLTLALLIGAIVSHMPGRYRYYSLLHRRVVGHQDKG